MASREGPIHSVLLTLGDRSFLWEMSLMIIASINGMASGGIASPLKFQLKRDKPLLPPSIMRFAVKPRGESPCGQTPLTHACEFWP